jgi:hypothetical protein
MLHIGIFYMFYMSLHVVENIGILYMLQNIRTHERTHARTHAHAHARTRENIGILYMLQVSKQSHLAQFTVTHVLVVQSFTITYVLWQLIFENVCVCVCRLQAPPCCSRLSAPLRPQDGRRGGGGGGGAGGATSSCTKDLDPGDSDRVLLRSMPSV